MDEQMEYAEMLEIPVSTIEVKTKRGRKTKKAQNLKEEVISKVNDENKTTKVKRGRKSATNKTSSVAPSNATRASHTDAVNIEELPTTMQTINPVQQNTPIEEALSLHARHIKNVKLWQSFFQGSHLFVGNAVGA